jgi:hypothetical protein
MNAKAHTQESQKKDQSPRQPLNDRQITCLMLMLERSIQVVLSHPLLETRRVDVKYVGKDSWQQGDIDGGSLLVGVIVPRPS